MQPLLRVNTLLRAIVGVVMVACCGIVVWWTWIEPIREKDRFRNCAINMRQIGLGLMQYAQDNDEYFPRAWYGHDAGPSDVTTNYKWMDAIYPYVKKEDLFICQSDRVNAPYHFRRGRAYGSYVYNNAYYAPGDDYSPPSGAAIATIAQPSMTILLTDGEHDFQAAWPDVQHTPAFKTPEKFQLGTMVARHERRWSKLLPLFCDGHVEANPMEMWLAPKVINGHTVYTGLTIEAD